MRGTPEVSAPPPAPAGEDPEDRAIPPPNPDPAFAAPKEEVGGDPATPAYVRSSREAGGE